MLLLEVLNLSASIVCAKSCDNYTWLHFTDQSKHLLVITLKKVETQLPSFIRIHKSSLINPTHVVHMKSEGSRHLTIYMSNGMIIPVARRRAERVRQLLEELIKYKLLQAESS